MVLSRRRKLTPAPSRNCWIAAKALAATTDLVVSRETVTATAIGLNGRVFRERSGLRVWVFPTALYLLYPRTLMVARPANDILPTRHGYPFTIRLRTKSGFKTPKFITTTSITHHQPRGFWTDRGTNRFSGI